MNFRGVFSIMAKFLSIVICFLFLFCMSSCRLQTDGNTLHGFTQRMNELSESYDLSDTGYIYDEEKETLTKFFSFSSNEIMIQFKKDTNNKLAVLNIVFGNINENNREETEFIKNCIMAFVDNDTVSYNLFESIEFDKIIYEQFHETKKEKIDDIEMLIDTTDSGTVITVMKDNP